MVSLATLADDTSIMSQFATDAAPVVLVNVFSVAPEDVDALLATWTKDAAFMRAQPGFLGTQLHRGLAPSTLFMNYAVWTDTASFRAAFQQPDFQRHIAEYPASAIARPHLFTKLDVPGICDGGPL